jgi:hypothetical protein
MAGDPVTAVSNVVTDGIELVTQKDTQLNTQDEINSRLAQQLQDLKDQITAALEKGEEGKDEIRRLCAS